LSRKGARALRPGRKLRRLKALRTMLVEKLKLNYRLYPKTEHEGRLLETLGLYRQTYNYFFAQWNGKERVPSRLKLQAQLPKLKQEKP